MSVNITVNEEMLKNLIMVLDNTNLDRAQQFELAMQWAMEKIKSS